MNTLKINSYKPVILLYITHCLDQSALVHPPVVETLLCAIRTTLAWLSWPTATYEHYVTTETCDLTCACVSSPIQNYIPSYIKNNDSLVN